VAAAHVRFAPKADKSADISLSPLSANSRREQVQQIPQLLDHLVGAGEQRRSSFEAAGFLAFEVLDSIG
jgi:hypothetical protein